MPGHTLLTFLIILALLWAGYAAFQLSLFTFCRKRYPKSSGFAPKITILVPARNEEAGIADCLDSLKAQTYSPQNTQVIVIDDASHDKTAQVAEDTAVALADFKLIRQTAAERGIAPKKEAIKKGIAESTGEIVFLIDADTSAHPEWVKTTLGYFTERTGVVFGWVGIKNVSGVFDRIQDIEYISLLGIAAGFAGMGIPTMCNANNLAFRRKAYDQVGGYEGIDNQPSGDDELLMQKIRDQTGWETAFCPLGLNQTTACPGILPFLHQRIRWASKGPYYTRSWLQAFLLGLYAFYLSFPLCLLMSCAHPAFALLAGIGFLGKFLADLPLAAWSLCRTGRIKLLIWLPLAEVFQIFYIPIVGLAGTLGLYRWKR